MNYGFVLLGSAVAGAVGWYGAAVGVHQRIWEQRFEDAEALEQGHHLGPMPEPPVVDRKPRNHVLIYLFSILGSGFVVWLLSFIGWLFFVEFAATTTGESIPGAERVLSALMFAGIFGLIGFLFPGVLVGAFFQFKENRARLRTTEARLRRQYWEEREYLRNGLENGHISVTEAIGLLRGDTASPGEPAAVTATFPLPEPNLPLSPKEILALAAAVTRDGYVGVKAGMASTAATVVRILTSPDAPERDTTYIFDHDVIEAENAFIWAMHAFDANPRDEFRENFGEMAARETIDPKDREALRTLVAGLGAYRRAMALGNY